MTNLLPMWNRPSYHQHAHVKCPNRVGESLLPKQTLQPIDRARSIIAHFVHGNGGGPFPSLLTRNKCYTGQLIAYTIERVNALLIRERWRVAGKVEKEEREKEQANVEEEDEDQKKGEEEDVNRRCKEEGAFV